MTSTDETGGGASGNVLVVVVVAGGSGGRTDGSKRRSRLEQAAFALLGAPHRADEKTGRPPSNC